MVEMEPNGWHFPALENIEPAASDIRAKSSAALAVQQILRNTQSLLFFIISLYSSHPPLHRRDIFQSWLCAKASILAQILSASTPRPDSASTRRVAESVVQDSGATGATAIAESCALQSQSLLFTVAISLFSE
jgi:hypothetical protein